MAEGTILAELVLEGDRSFKRAVESSGEKMDDAASDATGLSAALGFAGERMDALSGDSLSLAGAFQVLGGRADEAGDEIGRLGRTSAVSSLGVRSLSSSLPTLNLGLLSVSGTLTGLMIPALALLSTTLFPLAAIVGTVGAALAGIGIGVFAGGAAAAAVHTQTLQDAFADLQKELKEVVEPLADAFLPVLLDIMDRIPDVVDETLDLVGGLDEFADSVGDVADAGLDILPETLALFVEFGQLALPIIENAIRLLGRRLEPAFRGMLRVTRELAPELMRFGRAFVNAIPELTAVGTVILNTLLPAFADFMGLIEDVIQLGAASNGLVDFLQTLTSRALAWVQSEGVSILSSISSAILGGLSDAFAPGEGEAKGGRTGILGGLVTVLTDGLQGVATWLKNGGGKQQITNVITSLFGALDGMFGNESATANAIVTPLMSIIGSAFDALVAALNSDEARSLGASIGEMATETLQTLAEKLIAYARSDAFKKDLAGLTTAVANSVGAALAAGVGNAFEVGSIRVLEPGPQMNPITPRTGTVPSGPRPGSGWMSPEEFAAKYGTASSMSSPGTQTIEVTGTLTTEDGEFVAKIDEQVQTKMEQQAEQSDLQ